MPDLRFGVSDPSEMPDPSFAEAITAERDGAYINGKPTTTMAFLAWENVSGFGPDAVMLADESALYEPRDDNEQAAADGKLELVGKRALSDMGNDLGAVSDVVFDPATGALETVVLAGCDGLNIRLHVPGITPQEIRDQLAALGEVVPRVSALLKERLAQR